MIKFTFVMEDVEGSIERLESGNYLLKAKSEEFPEQTKEITGDQAASILFCSFDPSVDADPYETAQEALKGFDVPLIP